MLTYVYIGSEGTFENVYVNKTIFCEFFIFSLFYISQSFVEDLKVSFEISTTIWQKKNCQLGPFLGGGPKSCQKIKHCELLDRLPLMGRTFLTFLSDFPFRTAIISMLRQMLCLYECKFVFLVWFSSGFFCEE